MQNRKTELWSGRTAAAANEEVPVNKEICQIYNRSTMEEDVIASGEVCGKAIGGKRDGDNGRWNAGWC